MVFIHCCGVEGFPGGREGGDGDHSLVRGGAYIIRVVLHVLV